MDGGHEVTLFLAGDAVQLLREQVLDSLVGLGTGSLRESYDAIVRSGGRIEVSGNPSKARGFEPDGQAGTALPSRLVELALESDRVLTSIDGEGDNCECGEVVRAASDDELVEKVEHHVGEAHPELVGKLSREDVLGMAEEA